MNPAAMDPRPEASSLAARRVELARCLAVRSESLCRPERAATLELAGVAAVLLLFMVAAILA
ncbi:MAG: hypothetical protein AAF628_06375 [Planctomycetota bacterium]